jgi:hypothetical protein
MKSSGMARRGGESIVAAFEEGGRGAERDAESGITVFR